MSSPSDSTTIRQLSGDEARDFLTQRHVGRLAFALHDRVDIEPIHFVCSGDWIFGRTSIGTKLGTLLHNPWCAFETDEVQDLYNWTSVVVKGTFSILDPETGSSDTYLNAVEALRSLIPGIFTRNDPVPQRDIVFGLYMHEVSGRASRHE